MNNLPPFPQHLTPYCLKYFLDFICVLIYLFLLSQSRPLMFTMYYYLLILINRKTLITCLTDFSKIALNLLPLLSVFSSTSSQPLLTSLQHGNCVNIPLHKSGSSHDVKNYRPISILPSLSKVFEKLIHKHLYSYFETNNLLYTCNSGFRKYHSTTSDILEVTHKLIVAKDSSCSSQVVFLDISKAFDKVIHSALF